MSRLRDNGSRLRAQGAYGTAVGMRICGVMSHPAFGYSSARGLAPKDSVKLVRSELLRVH